MKNFIELERIGFPTVKYLDGPTLSVGSSVCGSVLNLADIKKVNIDLDEIASFEVVNLLSIDTANCYVNASGSLVYKENEDANEKIVILDRNKPSKYLREVTCGLLTLKHGAAVSLSKGSLPQLVKSVFMPITIESYQKLCAILS